MSHNRDRPSFIHDDPELFEAALALARKRHGAQLATELIEKDYWVTQTLDALQRAGFEVHFKGGTSLSKGYRLIERFSEDLDLKLDAQFLPDIEDRIWKRTDDKAQLRRRQFFDELLRAELPAPLSWSEFPDFNDAKLRNLGVRVDYPQTVDVTDPLMRPFVLLEVGRARVTPYVEREISSWVHDELEHAGREVARPTVRCVHPLVTLFEKSSALQGRATRDDLPPARYVRHFEDAVHILRAWDAGKLPPVPGYDSPAALAAELVRTKDTVQLDPDHEAFSPSRAPDRAERQRQALAQLAPYYWGPRVSLEQACDEIGAWLRRNL